MRWRVPEKHWLEPQAGVPLWRLASHARLQVVGKAHPAESLPDKRGHPSPQCLPPPSRGPQMPRILTSLIENLLMKTQQPKRQLIPFLGEQSSCCEVFPSQAPTHCSPSSKPLHLLCLVFIMNCLLASLLFFVTCLLLKSQS